MLNRSVFIAFLFLAGCAPSRHHLGFFNLGPDNRPFAMVGQRYVKDLSAVEAFWVKTLAAGRLDALQSVMAPNLAEAMTPDVRAKVSAKITKAYGPTGDYEIVNFGVPWFSLQEGVKRDAYDYYDMVGTAFTLEGKIPAALHLYVTKVDGALKICGFEMYPAAEGDREAGRDIRYVYPETVNKANVPTAASRLSASVK